MGTKVAFAPDGVVAGDPWSGTKSGVAYDNLDYGNRWLGCSWPGANGH
jgi:hypothetical protein